MFAHFGIKPSSYYFQHMVRGTHLVVYNTDRVHSLHFAFALCYHSNATRSPIANLPNTAQLGGSLYHAPSYIRVRAVV